LATVRLFVAVWPDPDTVARIAALALQPDPGLRLVAPDRWHVTLQFLGAVDDNKVPILAAALGRSMSDVPGPVSCTVGPATAWFAGRRVLQLPVAGLDEIARVVRTTTRTVLPSDSEEPEFVGHLTLARRRRGRGEGGRRRSPEPRVDALSLWTVFTVESIDLVASELESQGARYSRVASFPLGR
jgi:RNA 2',3'-cyclic 3'-phosphodiesterase